MTTAIKSTSRSITDQPPPKINIGPHVWDLVVEDMRNRDEVGAENYGTHLQPFNGRDALVDAYHEALDLAAYLRQEIYERDAHESLRGAFDEVRKNLAAPESLPEAFVCSCGGGCCT